MEKTFTDKDIAQIVAHGLTLADVQRHMNHFLTGFPYLDIDRAAVAGDGIYTPDAHDTERLVEHYLSSLSAKKVVKFVPASGAATRMFKDLFSFVQTGERNQSAQKTVDNIEKFAFRNALPDTIAEDTRAAAQAVLDYGAQLPKGLILFHEYADEIRTAAEEHLVEGAEYAAADGKVKIHFTVSLEHEKGFRKLVDATAAKYEKRFGVKYEISFSHQKPSTDTIAVAPDNTPFREKDGSLLFRPAGHGALIDNLGELDADIIFIKNIDNVTTDRLKPDTVTFKQAAAGLLLTLQEKAFGWLRILDAGADETAVENIRAFVEQELCYRLPGEFASLDALQKAERLRAVLDRPMRICAMVRNEGEPGGGPFWVRATDGSQTLQIGEMSQVAPDNKDVFRNGTHFNPVDLVCGVKDYKGNRYDLPRFADPATGFISEKSKDGKALRALELPGLWNGAMARWNTVFMEVPVSTFTPVKEVNDLLRPEHRT